MRPNRRLVAAFLCAALMLGCASSALAVDVASTLNSGLTPTTAAIAPEEMPVLYTGVMIRDMTVRETPDRDARAIDTVKPNEKINICSFTPEWVLVRTNKGMGYILRVQVTNVEPVNAADTLPYGAVKHLQIATVATDTAVYTAQDTSGSAWANLKAGSRISLWYIQDGWAKVPYQRGIGFVPVSALTGLTPVSPTAEYAQSGDLISAFTSFYDTRQTDLNSGRMVNIGVACGLISNVLEPGERFSFNDIAGPYNRTMGYMPAPVLFEGSTVAGYGGGTCQVSTTLYNTLIQLPQGITIVHRRPHGPSGAKYVPHGVDAAVGTPTQNLIFMNSYPFPVRIDAYAQDGALFVALYKV